ncbi:sigma D regulator [Pseudomonas matsuisoli]|uniref:Sigma D regulator n=1 Tax=Pseudomonas matsuisoli TaxID=1515666 RepID=A0A917UYF3_9PSED|nr:sigma D regulator [Pseudomonas matsuisoli]GGJ96275.1 sigma D regulator [Pseudomonas matsuisoli]
MLNSCENVQERWGGVNQLVDRWLHARHELIKAYADMNDKAEVEATTAENQREFCGILLDYVSAGHFEVYEQLLGEAEAFGDTRGIDFAHQIYPRIEASTEAVLAYNDGCEARASNANAQAQFKRLGQMLQERFELEDCLIEVLHKAHEQAQTAPEAPTASA